jgi:LacI family transcriptional regulator
VSEYPAKDISIFNADCSFAAPSFASITSLERKGSAICRASANCSDAHNDRARSRIEGVRQSLAKAGLSLPPARVTEQAFNFEGGRLGLLELLKAEQPPTAIFCGNDLLAVGALLEAQRLGLQVPGDLSICGIDDLEIAQAINPGLTTVSLPTRDLGRIAALSVLSAISGEVIAEQSLLPFDLVVRGSTAAPRTLL